VFRLTTFFKFLPLTDIDKEIVPQKIVKHWYSLEYKPPKDPFELGLNDDALSKKNLQALQGAFYNRDLATFYSMA
jgi:hypothetical protein